VQMCCFRYNIAPLAQASLSFTRPYHGLIQNTACQADRYRSLAAAAACRHARPTLPFRFDCAPCRVPAGWRRMH